MLATNPSRTAGLLLALSACAGAPSPAPPSSPGALARPAELEYTPVGLPGATAPASLDYIAFEPAHSRVWVPVGGTGSVDVYDTARGTFTRVDGFQTAERQHDGKTRVVGPSAVSIGDGTAYVGNRATSEVCPIDTGTLELGACLKLASPTDGVAFVAPAKEVWVTTPRDRSIAVLDAASPGTLKAKTVIRLDGEPEGYAVDVSRGLFFTNLEDQNKTVVIDIRSHRPVATWSLDCDAKGPRGIAVDSRGLVFAACTDHVTVLDGQHEGAALGRVDTGAGVDNIDWFEPGHSLYVAAGASRRLTVARIDDRGRATVVAVGTSVEGARNGVVDSEGNAYVADPANARLLIFRYIVAAPSGVTTK